MILEGIKFTIGVIIANLTYIGIMRLFRHVNFKLRNKKWKRNKKTVIGFNIEKYDCLSRAKKETDNENNN